MITALQVCKARPPHSHPSSQPSLLSLRLARLRVDLDTFEESLHPDTVEPIWRCPTFRCTPSIALTSTQTPPSRKWRIHTRSWQRSWLLRSWATTWLGKSIWCCCDRCKCFPKTIDLWHVECLLSLVRHLDTRCFQSSWVLWSRHGSWYACWFRCRPTFCSTDLPK